MSNGAGCVHGGPTIGGGHAVLPVKFHLSHAHALRQPQCHQWVSSPLIMDPWTSAACPPPTVCTPHPNVLPTHTDVPPPLPSCRPPTLHIPLLPPSPYCHHPPLSSCAHLILPLLYLLHTLTLQPPSSQTSPLAHLPCSTACTPSPSLSHTPLWCSLTCPCLGWPP